MENQLCYTEEEISMIDGVIGSLYARMSAEALRTIYWNIHERLQAGIVAAGDLPRIESALELANPGQCESCNKESYRDLTALLLKTRAMARAAS